MNQTNRPFQYHHVIALLLVGFSFFMSALVSRTVLERLPHLEDEMAYLFQARTLARGQAVIESPEPRRAFWQPFVPDRAGKRFGKYSLGWPLLLAPGAAAGQPWVVNALFSGLTVALVYRLGREIFSPDTGVFAAALTAFSPMALLLNGTLMGHTSALFTTTLFLFACWRLECNTLSGTGDQRRRILLWGLVAGVALGMTVINRPLAGVAVAAPLVAWSAVRLWRSRNDRQQLKRTLAPLLVLAGVTIVITAAIPAYNYAATGDASQNLYRLVWDYDRVGFGEGYGRRGHTLEKGLRQTRWDLSLTAADVFGWQTGTITPELQEHLQLESVYWPNVGLSWILLPFGLLIGLGRRWWWWVVWLTVGIAMFMYTVNLPAAMLQDPRFAVGWMGAGAVWMLIPFAFYLDGKYTPQAVWTWLLLAIPIALVGLHIAYWIGSQRYSTRYYYEGLTALALVSAIPLGWLAARGQRWLVYGGVTLVLLYSLYAYSTPRIEALYRFNWVSEELIDAVESRRTDDRPVLVLIRGTDVRWRAFGSLMASTSPFLDSPIVAAWDYTAPGLREQILALFPDRQVIEMTANVNRACFGADMTGECYGAPPG